MGYIYKITNTVNGKAYIGQTINKPEYRINMHFCPSAKSCSALHNAIRKYGRDAFTVEILHEALDIFLDDLEIAEIKRHNTLVPNGYNIEGGGHANNSYQTRQKISAANKGRKRSPETCQNISKSKKGRPLSPEHRKKLSESHKGKTLSPEHRQKISNGNKGKTASPETRKKLSDRKWSPETRKKISESHKGKKHSPETRKKLSDRRQCLEYRRKMSEVNAHPKRAAAFEILNSLPESPSVTDAYKILRNKFPEITRSTIRGWAKKWASFA